MSQGQTKKMSFVESLVNTGIGYTIAVASQYLIFPLFGVYIPFGQHMLMGGLFTIVSVIRSYYVRRLFNWWHIRKENART